ncbi:hypothetical protein BpHYR1_045981 [Brachionus plicatilis]|uniref:Uncharacterized protein n=1 Tax=Brachionus plicatilis TaxID=10195 RepID=A0A3M7T728_BRAPC|nr:hypothetical protein BpHYR1_045981 [Brachionus plicatilis]
MLGIKIDQPSFQIAMLPKEHYFVSFQPNFLNLNRVVQSANTKNLKNIIYMDPVSLDRYPLEADSRISKYDFVFDLFRLFFS